ncbi:MAG TPA: hypothetical protein VMX57_03040, partial [Planctomycetota bacterium]|nr:hypothetical protein [Planctomycetota bacterium]
MTRRWRVIPLLVLAAGLVVYSVRESLTKSAEREASPSASGAGVEPDDLRPIACPIEPPVPPPPAPPAPTFVVSRVRHEGLEVVTVENAKIRVAFLPSVGGRLWYYALRDGRNELWNNPEFVNPREVERYHAWGGLDDHLDLRGGLSGPVRLPMEPYACTVVESDDNVTVTLTYENPWVRLVRTHVVYPDTTRLTTREVVTNLDDAPRVLAPRPHPVFAVGGDVDNLDVPCALASVDYLLEAAPGGALVQRYALPIHRDVTTPVAGNWAGAVDPEKNEAVILTFDRRNVDEINLWFDRASYNVEPLARARMLEKNASAEVSFDMFILSGDNLADQAHALPVDRDAARQIATALDVFENRLDVLEHVDREAFYLAAWGYWWVTLPPAMTAGGKPLALEVWAGTFDAEPAKLDAKLAVVNAGDGKEVDSPEAKVTVGVCESEGETGRWV